MRDYDFIQHVDVPAYVRGNMLDLIFTNEGGVKVSEVCVVDAGVADHFLVMCHLHVKQQTETKTSIYARHMKSIDQVKFAVRLNDMMAAADMPDSVDDYCDMFTSSLRTLLEIRREAAPGHFMFTPKPSSYIVGGARGSIILRV